MSEGLKEEKNEEDKKVRNMLEETFARYEPRKEALELPGVKEAPAREKRAPERIAPKLEIGALRLVPTGISGLDAMLEGGLPDHSLILASGEDGSHYETFIGQVLHNHIYEGGKVAYYLAESLSVDLRQEMERYGWSLKEYVGRGSWVFVNLRTPDLQQLAELTPQALSEGLTVPLARGLNSLKTDLLSKVREERWTILELSHLLHNYEFGEVLSLILYWRAAVRIYGGVHFAVLPLGVHPENIVNAIRHLADGVLEFHLREGPREFETFVAVRRMRGLKRPLMISFTVEDDGIAVETLARIA
jgi:KaiC/GvpD/RAD55 family RecA-like ATPase